MTLGDFFEENPRARPLLMFAVFAVILLMVGFLFEISKKKKAQLVEEALKNTAATQTVAATPDATSASNPADPVPTGGPSGEDTPGQPPPSTHYAWITENEVSGSAKPGINEPAVRKFKQWEEISHIRQEENWDLIRGNDGKELWVPSKYVRFTRPVNKEKPSEAEVTIMDFYQAVAREDYGAAYDYLSAPWKRELDMNTFVDGYARTKNLRTVITAVHALGGKRFQVSVSLTAREGDVDVPYEGSYTVEKAGDRWDMTSGTLTKVAKRERDLPQFDASPSASPPLPERKPGGEPPVSVRTPSPPAPEASPAPGDVLATPEPAQTPAASTTPAGF